MGIHEAHLYQAYKPCIIQAIPSQTYTKLLVEMCGSDHLNMILGGSRVFQFWTFLLCPTLLLAICAPI